MNMSESEEARGTMTEKELKEHQSYRAAVDQVRHWRDRQPTILTSVDQLLEGDESYEVIDIRMYEVGEGRHSYQPYHYFGVGFEEFTILDRHLTAIFSPDHNGHRAEISVANFNTNFCAVALLESGHRVKPNLNISLR